MIFLRKLKLFLINGLVLTVISIFLQLIGVSFGVYISNKIGDEAVGLYQLLMSTYSFGITLALSGINLACVRIVSEELATNSFDNIKVVIRKCLIYSLFFATLTFFLFCTFSGMISTYILHEKISPSTICIMAISFPFASICSCLNGYFSAVRHVVKSAIIQILEQLFKILLVSYMLNILFNSSINSACSLIVLGSSIAEGITCILMFITYIKDRKKLCLQNTSKISIKNTKSGIVSRIFKISLPISSATYIKSGLATLKQVVIPLKLEAFGLSCSEALSKYGMINGMVFPIILFPSTFLSSFSSLLIPEFSSFNVRGENNVIQDSIYKILKYTTIFSFFVIGIFMCFSKELSILIYNNDEIAKYIKILAPVIIFMYLDSIVDGILKGLDKQVSVMIINIIDLISSILLISFLLPIYGTFGYLIVIFISEILNCILSIWVLISTTKIKFKFKLWILKPTIILLISIAITNFLKINAIAVFPLIVNILIYSIAYIVFSLIFNVISKTEIKNFL